MGETAGSSHTRITLYSTGSRCRHQFGGARVLVFQVPVVQKEPIPISQHKRRGSSQQDSLVNTPTEHAHARTYEHTCAAYKSLAGRAISPCGEVAEGADSSRS